ncbi:MAG: sugar ABC transporter permease [Proteobacteria bacterium]|nr:sugar ABC transporter permease [Pseudomonadota bacterium]
MERLRKIDFASEKTFVWVCMLPVLAFLALVAVAPTTVALIDSVRHISLTSFAARGEFIGLDNFRDLLSTDEKFYTAFWHTALFVVVVVPIEFFGGLAIALWINREFRGRRLILTLIMIPTVIAPVVVGLIWLLFFLPSFGLLTQSLNYLGFFRNTGVFSSPETALVALMISDIWEWTPFVMLILLAGLTAMPKAPIEAARLDGASRADILWHIQIPLLKPLIIIALLLRSIDASKIFDSVYVLTGGGPGDSTEMITTFAHRTSFMSWNLGYGAAVCLVLAFVSLVLAALFYKVAMGIQR